MCQFQKLQPGYRWIKSIDRKEKGGQFNSV